MSWIRLLPALMTPKECRPCNPSSDVSWLVETLISSNRRIDFKFPKLLKLLSLKLSVTSDTKPSSPWYAESMSESIDNWKTPTDEHAPCSLFRLKFKCWSLLRLLIFSTLDMQFPSRRRWCNCRNWERSSHIFLILLWLKKRFSSSVLLFQY